MTRHEIDFPLQPKQLQLITAVQLDKFVPGRDGSKKLGSWIIGYGGARGGSKSRAGRDMSVIEALRTPNVQICFFRRKWSDLYDNQIGPLFQERPWLRRFWHDTKKKLFLPNDSIIHCETAEYDDDIFDLQGKAFDRIIIDESQQCTQKQIEFLETVCRQSTACSLEYSKMILLFNPGGVGHAYHKAIFVDKLYSEDQDPDNYQFIQSYLWDNVIWVRPWLKAHNVGEEEYYTWPEEKRMALCLREAQYAKNLMNKPEHIRRASVFGDWNTFVGQFFQMYHQSIHDVPEPPWKDEYGNIQYEAVIGSDYGNDTVFELIVCDSEKNTYFVDELVIEDATLGAERKAEMFLEWAMERGIFNVTVIGDTNMFQRLGFDVGISKTPSDFFYERDVKLQRISKRPMPHKHWTKMCNEAFTTALYWERDEKTGKIKRMPKMFFVEGRCPRLRKSLTELLVSDVDYEAIADNQWDHAYDAAKNGYMFINAGAAEPPPPRSVDYRSEEYMKIRDDAGDVLTENSDYCRY